MPVGAISSSFMLLLQGHVNCRNFTLSHAWFPGALLLLLGNNSTLSFLHKNPMLGTLGVTVLGTGLSSIFLRT